VGGQYRLQQESRVKTIVNNSDADRHTVPSLYILRLNKHLKIMNSSIGLGSNWIITNYSIWS